MRWDGDWKRERKFDCPGEIQDGIIGGELSSQSDDCTIESETDDSTELSSSESAGSSGGSGDASREDNDAQSGPVSRKNRPKRRRTVLVGENANKIQKI